MPLFEWECDNPDGFLVAELLSKYLNKYKLNATVQFMHNGVLVFIFQGAGHTGSWEWDWYMDKSNQIDTGMEETISLANPKCEKILEAHTRLTIERMKQICTCATCRLVRVP